MRELSAHYKEIRLSKAPVLAVYNATLVTASHIAQRATEMTMVARQLAFHVLPLVKVPAQDATTAAQVLMVHEAQSVRETHSGGPRPPSPIVHSVSSGDTLSALAHKYYGAASKWPLLYVANQSAIGPNPDKIKPGQRLIVPSAPKLESSMSNRTIKVEPLR